MRKLLILAAALLSVAASTPPPLPGSAGRDFAATAPAFKTPSDYGATGNAKRRPAQVSIGNASSALALDTTYSIPNPVYNCTNASGVVTMTPAAALPATAYVSSNTIGVVLPGCGASGATAVFNISTITSDGTTLTINVAPNASTTVTNGTSAVTFAPQTSNLTTQTSQRRLTHNVAQYSAITYTAGSTTITAPNGTFNTQYDLTQRQEYLSARITEIAIPNAAGASCNQTFISKILTVTAGDTITVADAPTCSSSATKEFWWGASLFAESDIGKSIELIDGGGAVGSNTNLVTTIAGFTDPTHITLTGQNTTAKTRMPTELTWGTDATAGFISMATAARAAGHRYLYIPNASAFFLATGVRTTLTPDAWSLAWCGEGRVFMPRSLGIEKAVAQSCTNGMAPPVIDNTIVPSLHLRTALTTGSSWKVLFVGDSQMTSSYPGIGHVATPDYLCDAFKNKNPLKSVQCQNYAIGGSVWHNFDTGGPSSGNGAGLPSGSSATWGTWYTPTSNTWQSFAQTYCPHTIVFKWGFNDQFNFLWGSFVNILDSTQSSTWRSSCGYNPDILIATEGVPGLADAVGTTHALVDKIYTQTFLRGYVLSCEYKLTNGGCLGLLDIGRARMLLHHGWTDEDLIPRRATYVTPNSSANDGMQVSSATYTWPINTYDFGATMAAFRATSTDVPTFWAAVGNVDFSWGNGALATPASAGTQTGLAMAYTGQKLRLGLTGSNYQVTVYTFDVSQSATVTTTGGGSTVACASACTNMGFNKSTIDVPGAGVAGGTYTGTITAVSSDGKTLTVTPTTTTALTAQVKTLRFYHQALAPTETGVAALCTVVTTFCQSNFSIHKKGSMVTLYDGNCLNCAPMWQGRVASFGGPSRPTITITGTFANYKLTTNATGLGAVATDGTPENGTPYAIAMTDNEVWGSYNDVGGIHGGQASIHPGMQGDTLTFNFLAGLNLSATASPSTAVVNTPTAGFSYTIPDFQEFTSFTPAGVLATGTVTLPRNVPEGDLISFFSSQTITALTVNAPSGYTLSGTAVTTIAGNATISYRRIGTVFYRVQ